MFFFHYSENKNKSNKMGNKMKIYLRNRIREERGLFIFPCEYLQRFVRAEGEREEGEGGREEGRKVLILLDSYSSQYLFFHNTFLQLVH